MLHCLHVEYWEVAVPCLLGARAMMPNADPAADGYFELPPKPMELDEKVKQKSTISGEQQLKNSKRSTKHKSESNVKDGKSSRKANLLSGTKQGNMTGYQCCALTMIIMLVILGIAMTALLGAVALSDCFGIEQCPIISLI
uniref:Uncharacterized protein n=1 Tax=Ascaris lumbricoides TaxID=6252 RepID=A0A0M3II02_ASCLU